MWPAELDELESGAGKYKPIARRDLFKIAQRATEEKTPWSAAQLHVACIAWGTDPGRDLIRALRPLHEVGAAEKLSKALDLVQTEGAVSAYRALQNAGRLKVKYLGAGFFTKLLYFGGYDARPHLARPLIYDSRVVAALRRLTSDSWETDGSPDMYTRYLDIAADWAAVYDTTPDVIERQLFGR
jgi:hypothetical protein